MVNKYIEEIISNIVNSDEFDIDKLEKDLSNIGINLYNENGNMKSFDTVMGELSNIWTKYQEDPTHPIFQGYRKIADGFYVK